MLPIPPLPTSTIEIAATTIEYHSLSRDEVQRLSEFDDTGLAEAFMIARSTGITEEEALDWRTKVDSKTVASLLEAIAVISGLRRGKGPTGN